MSYELTKYTPDFRDQILTLQTHLWSLNLAVNSAYFRWKHEENPYLHEPLVYLALHKGRVVGMRGFFGAEWEIGDGGRLTGPCGGDTCVLPDHRGRGLFRKINEFALDDLARLGFTWVFNLSAGAITYLGSLRQGWRCAGPFATLRRLVAQTSPAPATMAPTADPALSLSDAPRAGPMADLVDRLGHDGRVRHVRDRVFFEWRLRNPLSRYRYFYWGADELLGYLVLQRRLHKTRSYVGVADWEAIDDEIKLRLLAAAVASTPDEITIWSASLPTGLAQRLKAYGFASVDE